MTALILCAYAAIAPIAYIAGWLGDRDRGTESVITHRDKP